MLEAALRSGAAAPAQRLRGLRPPPARGAPVRRRRRHRPAARGARPGSASRTTSSARWSAAGWSTPDTLRWLAGYRFGGHVWGYGEGEVFVPGCPLLVVEGTFAEAVLLETLVLSILNHDCAIAAAASRMTVAAAEPALPGDGLTAHPRGGGGGRRPRRVRRRVRRHQQPRGRPAVRRSPRWGRRRTPSPCCTTTSAPPSHAQVATPRRRHHPARRHLRRDAGRPDRGRGRGRQLGAVRLDSGDLLEQAYAVRAQLDRARRPRDPHRRDQRPRRVPDRRARRRPRSTPTAWGRRW